MCVFEPGIIFRFHKKILERFGLWIIVSVSAHLALKRYPLPAFPGWYFPQGYRITDHHSDDGYMPGQYRSGHVFQVNTEIGRNTRISLRVLFKLLFAPVAAEVILLVFVHTSEFSIFFINYCKTDRIGRHHSPRITTHYWHLLLNCACV
jgi:hypothetical protein